MSVDDTFNKLLDEYKSNYVQFVTTGSPEYQKAYTIARDAVQSMISEKQSGVEQERKAMKHYAGSYGADNASLSALHDKADGMQKNAQAIQDKYETSKKRYDTWVKNGQPGARIDYTNGYGFLWRVGALMVLLVLVFCIGFYNPGLVSSSVITGSSTVSLPVSAPGTPGTFISIQSPQWGTPRR